MNVVIAAAVFISLDCEKDRCLLAEKFKKVNSSLWQSQDLRSYDWGWLQSYTMRIDYVNQTVENIILVGQFLFVVFHWLYLMQRIGVFRRKRNTKEFKKIIIQR